MLFLPFKGYPSKLSTAELATFTDTPTGRGNAKWHMKRLRHAYPQPHLKFGTRRVLAAPEKGAAKVLIIIAFDSVTKAKAAIRRSPIPHRGMDLANELELRPNYQVPHPFTRERR